MVRNLQFSLLICSLNISRFKMVHKFRYYQSFDLWYIKSLYLNWFVSLCKSNTINGYFPENDYFLIWELLPAKSALLCGITPSLMFIDIFNQSECLVCGRLKKSRDLWRNIMQTDINRSNLMVTEGIFDFLTDQELQSIIDIDIW